MSKATASAPVERWSSRTGFILATIGSAVGIGSIWKFPYEVGENGGGAFVLLYLLGLALVVVPLLLAEFALGRRGRGDAATAIAVVAREAGASPRWSWIGWLGALTAFLILSFYSVICAWTLDYAWQSVAQGFAAADAVAVQARFDAMLASPGRMFIANALVMMVTMLIVARGIGGGIERATTVLMPLLAVLIIGLAVFSIVTGDAARTFHYLFRPDLSRLTAGAAIEALGLGFFSIGVGLGLMITYAGYSEPSVDLRHVAVAAVLGDTVISLLAGFAVFPVVFAHGLDPAGGAGLVFVTLPLAFASMPAGAFAATGFFVLLLVAGLSSAISMLEMVVAVLIRRCGWGRPQASAIAGVACMLAGIPTVLSFNVLRDWRPLGAFPDASVFGLIDALTSNVLLPLGALLIAVLVAWRLPAHLLALELRLGTRGATWLRALLRYVVPAVVLLATLAPLLLRRGAA